jgi:asparagine synthase (glutamine-hydrolysing)
MCGIAGYLDMSGRHAADRRVLVSMLDTLKHRGPDGEGCWLQGPLAMGTRRLSILDIAGSDQPLFNETRDLVLVGNGEIFNFVELRKELLARGHRFATQGDLEVVLHLYEDYGADFVHHVHGQFSVVLYDMRTRQLYLFRDHMGITPLFYAQFDRQLIFASEIKAILKHPAARREVDLQGLDQIICFPGLISPTTMFAGVSALRPGHYLRVCEGRIEDLQYWDLDYPPAGTLYEDQDSEALAGEFRRVFDDAVKIRMRSDRPVGVYLSGGLDSSFVAASMRGIQSAGRLVSFSIVFPESRSIDERRYQRLMAQHLELEHVEIAFREADIAEYLRAMVWHAECPVKETYNTCSMALAKAAGDRQIPVVLGGEGADELLGGYPGYRFDSLAAQAPPAVLDADEARVRARLWGNAAVRYERMYHQFDQWRRGFFSAAVVAEFDRVNCLARPPIRTDRISGRDPIHQRSYIDSKVRMADHLLGDHGDRMAMAASVEGRYPFLDRHVVDFVRQLSPEWKVRGLEEKILLKHAARSRVPETIIRREKFGFRAAGSPALLRMQLPFTEELLDPARLARQGYLNPATISAIVAQSRQPGAQFNPHAQDDLLLIAMTFGLFLELFDMPSLAERNVSRCRGSASDVEEDHIP